MVKTAVKSLPMSKINSCSKCPYQKKTYITPVSYRDINSQFAVMNGGTGGHSDELLSLSVKFPGHKHGF